MENNVHRDVHNADVCTEGKRGAQGEKHRGRRKRKRSEWDTRVGRRVPTRRKKRIEEDRAIEREGGNDKRKNDRGGRERGGHADEGGGGGGRGEKRGGGGGEGRQSAGRGKRGGRTRESIEAYMRKQ